MILLYLQLLSKVIEQTLPFPYTLITLFIMVSHFTSFVDSRKRYKSTAPGFTLLSDDQFWSSLFQVDYAAKEAE